MHKLLAGAIFLVAGCTSVAPSPRLAATPTIPSLSPAPAEASVAPSPCREPQVALTPGHSGAAAGTSYLRVFVELAQNPPCVLPRGPVIWLTNTAGAEVARSTETDASPVVLDYITGYNIGWNVACGPTTSDATAAHVEFSKGVVIEMPISGFGPSCVDGSRGSLFMIADDSR